MDPSDREEEAAPLDEWVVAHTARELGQFAVETAARVLPEGVELTEESVLQAVNLHEWARDEAWSQGWNADLVSVLRDGARRQIRVLVNARRSS